MPDGLPDIASGRYAFDLTLGPAVGDLAVRWGTREHHLRDAPLDYVSPRYAVLRYCIEGEGEIESGGLRWPVRPGVACWHGHGQPIRLVATTPVVISYALLLFGTELPAIWRRHLSVPVGAIALERPDAVRRLFEAVMAEGLDGGDGREEHAAAIARVLLKHFENAVAAADPHTAISRQTHRRLRQFIEEHYTRVASLAQVAAECQISVPYLCRVFERFDTVSPYTLLTDLKIARAERLLLEGTTSVADVALAVGYQDAKLFSRKFRAVYGTSPRGYRQAGSQ